MSATFARFEYTRDLLWVFFIRDLKVQYKRSLLGIVWSLIYPIVQLLVFAFLFKLVLGVETPRYSAYAFSGILAWSFFSNSVGQGTYAITTNRELVRQPGFPVALLPVTVLVTGLYHMLIAFPVLLVCLAIEDVPMGLYYVEVLPVLAAQAVLTLALIYLLASLNVVFRDVQHIVAVLLQLAMFVTPVFWERSVLPPDYYWVYDFNPMADLLEGYRAVMLHGAQPRWDVIGIIALASTGLLVMCHRWFVRMSHRFAEEL